MNSGSTTEGHITTAEEYFHDADGYCHDLNDQAAIAVAQVQATIGVGNAILALVRCLQLVGDDSHIPISGTVTR